MNFFSQLAALDVAGNFRIVATGTAEAMTVSLLVDNPAVGSDATKRISPIVLKGSAAELDAGFFGAIAAPVKTVSDGLQVLHQAEKDAEKLKKAAAAKAKTVTPTSSSTTTPAATPAKPAPAPKPDPFQQGLEAVQKFVGEKKYQPALQKLTELEKQFKDKKDDIAEARRKVISAYNEGATLFDLPTTPLPGTVVTQADAGLNSLLAQADEPRVGATEPDEPADEEKEREDDFENLDPSPDDDAESNEIEEDFDSDND